MGYPQCSPLIISFNSFFKRQFKSIYYVLNKQICIFDYINVICLKQFITAILLIIGFANLSYSQTLSNFRTTNLTLSEDSITVDTLSIVPNTFTAYTLEGISIPDSLYHINYAEALFVPNSSLKNDNAAIKLTYRVFPFNFSEEYYHKSLDIVTPSLEEPQMFSFSQAGSSNFFEQDKIDKRGSISRGVSFGNNQDVIVNSSLNLQLSGKISDNLEIMAAISDNNIPIQPDGNSQQIQEFDKVYISLFNDRNNLTVGDFELKKPVGNFMNLYKKAQGGIYTTRFDLNGKKEQSIKTTVSGAVSKGKYNRMPVVAREGNQGPYKLRGSNNETYIIILAGTEKVYIDGRLMARGQEYDYVIDYNTAEISFTPNQPITKDKRIVVEFEYSDKNYARFMLFNSTEFKSEKSRFWLNIYSEQDSKNQPIQQDLDDREKEILSNAGDSLFNAIVPNIDSVEFDNDLVLYKMVDTLVNSIQYDSILVYSTHSDSAFYRVGFSSVGPNNGNYEQISHSANGKVYEWIAPVGGVLQGDYEPVVLLITPKKKQMVAFGGETRISKTTKTAFEIALTDNDANTFSLKDGDDDIGYALKLKLMQNIPFKDTNKVQLNASVTYQLIDKYFDPIENFRDIEFNRDWNLTSQNQKEEEHLLNVNADFNRKNLGNATYNLNLMNRGLGYKAMKNDAHSLFRKKGFTLDLRGSLLNSEDIINKTTFLRHSAMLSKEIASITVGVREEQENNQWEKVVTDSLLNNSTKYEQWEVFANNSDTAKAHVFTGYKHRKDYQPFNNQFKYATLGQDLNLGVALMKSPNHNVKSTITYRKLTIIDSLLAENEADNNLTGRIEHNLKLLKGVITTSTFYEIGSGQEVKQEFSYLEVALGQGVYSWTDYNGNDVKELDEFEIANFQDEASYIRIFIPTNEYIKTYNNQFSELIYLNPARIWRNKKGLRKVISKFSNRLAYRVNRKNLTDDFLVNINPFITSIADSGLISISTSLRNTFSFNKTNQKFGVDYITQNNQNKILLLNGFDTRRNILNGLKFRWNITRTLTLTNYANFGEKSYSSEFFATKNYNIQYHENEASFSVQPTLSLRISIIHKYVVKENILNIERAEENNIGTEFRYNVLSKGNLSIKINYIKFTYNADTNTSVAYTMLEGFQPGNNATWTVLYQRSLSKTLQLNLTYNGRTADEIKPIHTGGVQLRAYF